MKAFLPLGLIALIIGAFPALENYWERHNPIDGAWQSATIDYYNASEYHSSLREGIRRWEDTGIDLRFRAVDDPQSADLIIESGLEGLRERCSDPECSGWATVGRTPFRRQSEIWLLPPSHRFEDDHLDFFMLPTIIHELGHVLGLDHASGECAVMNADSSCRQSRRPRFTTAGRIMDCGPWPEDLKALQRLYPEAQSRPGPTCRDPGADFDFLVDHGDQLLADLRRWLDNTK